MTTTIEAMKQAVDVLEKHSGNWRLSESEATHQTWVINDLLDAIAAEEAQTITPSKWPIAGIKVKIDGGAPNFHLYRLLGANDLAPGEYELFIRPTQAPAVARPINCGTGHCSCVECVVSTVKQSLTVERENLIAELRQAHAGHSDEGPSAFSDAADMLAADAQPTQVTCQTYGHVVGACAECNTHEEAYTPLAWRVSLDKGATWTIYETDPSNIHGMDAAIITPLVARHTPPTDWSAA